MPKVIDRPTTDTQAPTISEIEFPPPEPRKSRSPQIFRWLGWLLLAGAIAAVGFFAIEGNSDDVVETPTVAVNLDPGAITADPKPRTPLGETGTAAEVIEDATVNPGIYWSPRPVEQPDTQFPEESTVTPISP